MHKGIREDLEKLRQTGKLNEEEYRDALANAHLIQFDETIDLPGYFCVNQDKVGRALLLRGYTKLSNNDISCQTSSVLYFRKQHCDEDEPIKRFKVYNKTIQ